MPSIKEWLGFEEDQEETDLSEERRKGKPRTDEERREKHEALYEEGLEIENLPPRGTGLKRKSEEE